jgi:hypothetical protein
VRIAESASLRVHDEPQTSASLQARPLEIMIATRTKSCRAEMLVQASSIPTQLSWELQVLLDRLCGLMVRVPGYRSRGPGSIPALPDFLRSSGSGTGSTQPREYNEELLGRQSSGSGLESQDYGRGICHADHVSPSI